MTTIASFSIGFDRRTIYDPYISSAFPEFSALSQERREDMLFQIHDLNRNFGVDIFALQEIPYDLVPVYEQIFKDLGYDVRINPYADPEDKGAFRFLTAFHPNKVRCIAENQIYFTQSGSITYNRKEIYQQGGEEALRQAGVELEDGSDAAKKIFQKGGKEALFKENLGSEFEKSAPCFLVEELDEGSPTGDIFGLSNIHFGLTEEHRLLVAEKLYTEKLDDLFPEFAGSGIYWVTVGDANQFNPDPALKEMPTVSLAQKAISKKNGFFWNSEHLLYDKLGSTFVVFPYDIAFLAKAGSFDTLNKMRKIVPNPKSNLQKKTYHDLIEQFCKLISEVDLKPEGNGFLNALDEILEKFKMNEKDPMANQVEDKDYEELVKEYFKLVRVLYLKIIRNDKINLVNTCLDSVDSDFPEDRVSVQAVRYLKCKVVDNDFSEKPNKILFGYEFKVVPTNQYKLARIDYDISRDEFNEALISGYEAGICPVSSDHAALVTHLDAKNLPIKPKKLKF